MMKKIILGLAAASVAIAPMAASAAPAPQHRGYETQRTVVKHRPNGTVVVKQKGQRGQQYRTWHRGERFDTRYARNYRQIDYRHYRGLNAPPRGYRYVQSGNDAVLVGIASGVIAAVFANMIR
jgi:Ni/Co efflux regulator RcnB